MNLRQRGWLLPPAAVALFAGIFAGRAMPRLFFSLAACVTALAAVLLLKGWFRFVACVVLAFAVGTAAGCAAFHPSLPPEGDYRVTGVISGEVTYGRSGQVRIPLVSVTLDGREASGGAYWTYYRKISAGNSSAGEQPSGSSSVENDSSGNPVSDHLLPGKLVSFQASLYHPQGASNPDGYNFRESLFRRGITFGLYGAEDLTVRDPDFFSFTGSVASLRHRLHLALIRNLGEETGNYASALLLGMQSLIPSEDHEAFSNLGIAHILSVSGFHVGVLIGILALAFRLLSLKQPLRLFLFAVILLFYTALCGMNQPVIRAALFTLLAVEGRILNRPRSALHMLSAVMIVTLLISPAQVTGASFLLSYSAMLGVLWFRPWLQRLNPFRNRILSKLFDSLLITFGVQLAILVPQLYFYQRLPLLSFLVNLPAMTVFSVLIMLYWLALFLLPVPVLGGLLAAPLSRLTGLLLSGVRELGSLPGLTLWLPSSNVWTVLGIGLVFSGLCAFVRVSAKVRLPLLLAGFAAVILSLMPHPHTSTEYIQLSVGNADAAVLYDQDYLAVIDTGTSDGELSGYLRSHRLTPDLVILTHLHSDHAGGLEALLRDGIPVRTICLPAGAELQQIDDGILRLLEDYRAAGTEIRSLSRGDVLPLPSGTMTVLWPESGRIRPGQNANSYSLVSRLVLKGTSLLLTGDLTGEYEMYAAASSDILKAAHHGSVSSTGPDFISAVSPDMVLLSCRAASRTAGFRQRIGELPLWSTQECGAVTILFDESGYSVTPYLRPDTQED